MMTKTKKEPSSPPSSQTKPGLALSPAFTFDPVAHKYLVDGIEWPSPTGLLREFGLTNDSYFKPIHAERGRAVHLATQLWDEGDLDESSLDADVKAKLEGWKKFRQDTGFKPDMELREKPIVDRLYLFGVTPDAPGMIGRESVLVELKSGQVDKKSAQIQMAAQQLALQSETGSFFASMRIVQLLPGDYKIYPIPPESMQTNHDNFLAMVKVHWLKRQ